MGGPLALLLAAMAVAIGLVFGKTIATKITGRVF